MRQQVPMLVHGAALHWYAIPDSGKRLLQSRRAIDDEEFRPPQATLDQVVENRAPGFSAFSAHAFDCKQHLLAIRTHAEHDQQRDRCGFSIEPDANDRAVEDQPHNRLRGK